MIEITQLYSLLTLLFSYTEKVDVYAFGIILWEMATMELPYPNMDSIQIAVAVV